MRKKKLHELKPQTGLIKGRIDIYRFLIKFDRFRGVMHQYSVKGMLPRVVCTIIVTVQNRAYMYTSTHHTVWLVIQVSWGANFVIFLVDLAVMKISTHEN
jgi:hypothetical protein